MIDGVILAAIALCFVAVVIVERTGRNREIKNAKSAGYQSGYKDAACFYYDEHKNFLTRKANNQKGNTQ